MLLGMGQRAMQGKLRWGGVVGQLWGHPEPRGGVGWGSWPPTPPPMCLVWLTACREAAAVPQEKRDCLSTPSVELGGGTGMTSCRAGPQLCPPPPAPPQPLIAVLGPGPAALPVPIGVPFEEPLLCCGGGRGGAVQPRVVVSVWLVEVGVGPPVLLLLLQVP